MIGIPCYGEKHKNRLVTAVNRMTPEVYLFLLEVRGWITKLISDKKIDESFERFDLINRLDRLDIIMCRKRLPDENGDVEMIGFDIHYTDLDT